MPLNIRFMMLLALLLMAPIAEAQAHRRALLIGINDYTASRFTARPPLDRDWPNLRGAVRDAGMMRELLVALRGFDERDVVTLTDQAATREAILRAVEEHLIAKAEKDDVVFFYFAGHGSQVVNSLSAEPDKLDESLVPADSRAGAPDIRDKELRARFNRILDRGARLTVMLDNCHSGSGARGLATGAVARGVRPDGRDVRDGAAAGPRPEDRGALVLTATHDYGIALEMRAADGMHGVFTLAWMNAMRDAAPDEPASETFLRAQARMRAGTPFQEPAMAGDPASRTRPFLGNVGRASARLARNMVGVETVLRDGRVLLQGGWAHGLAEGAELRSADDARLKVTALDGVSRSEARVVSGAAPTSGALLEVVGWASPAGRPLRVWTPRAPAGMTALARRLATAAKERGIRWIDDPTERTPTHLLRFSGERWELLRSDGRVQNVAAEDALRRVPTGASLFVQLPVPPKLQPDVDAAASAEEADYILVGRYVRGRIEYAWIRPSVRARDQHVSALPVRSDWVHGERAAEKIRDAAMRLRRIHAWQQLESPPGSATPYRLALRGANADEPLVGGRNYMLTMRAASLPQRLQPRFFYAFVVDRFGRSYLAFPSGAVENYFPLPEPAAEIALAKFAVCPPYGVDTYFLLSTDEPLPNPWILEWDGVRTRAPKAPSALEQLLMLTGSGSRAPRVITPVGWSIERVVHESVPPPVKRARKKRH